MAQLIGLERTKLLSETPIKTYETDSKRRGLPSELVAENIELKGRKCFVCGGSPRKCEEVDCGDILVLETKDD